MTENHETKIGPMVSVLIPTFNRPRYLSESLTSALHQNYSNLQVIVVNDGGQDVSGIVNSFGDPRIIFINRKENRGKAFSLNQALSKADGKYITYLDDDDLYYPNHIRAMVDTLENRTDCQVAYSDLYKAYYRPMRDGSRQVLSKVVEISRDFDRFFMLYFNQALHVSLMHRRDLIERTGHYNEKLNVLIDWDMTRRLAFFSDFHHVYEITGEFYSSIGESDRISVLQRRDKNEYLKHVMAIRTTRPAKPWTKIKDMSIIFDADRLDQQAGETIGLVWRCTFYPYRFYLPLPQADFSRINTEMPNLVMVPVSPSASQAERIDASLAMCDSEYVAIVPDGFPVNEMWVENPLYALINCPVGRQGFEMEGSTDNLWAAVVRKEDLEYARRRFPNMSVRQSLLSAGIVLRQPAFEELPFQFDDLMYYAQLMERDGNCTKAARIFEYVAEHHHNQLWMNTLAAMSFFKAGNYIEAAKLSREVNHHRPTVDTLLLEATVRRKEKKFGEAIALLERAGQILEGKRLLWT